MTDKKAQVLAGVLAEMCTNNCACKLGLCFIDTETLCEDVTPQHWLDYAERKAGEVKDAE